MLAFIIFGWGGGRRKDHGPAVPATCPNCRNAILYRSFSVTKWFSLFFIPLIPYQTRHFLLCPVCTRGMQLDHAQVALVKQMVESSAAFSAGTMSQVDYEQRVQSFWAAVVGQSTPQGQVTTDSNRPAIPPPPSAMPPPPTPSLPPESG